MARLPHPVPPVQPKRPENPSNTEWERYLLRLRAWFAGEILRTIYFHGRAQENADLVGDYPLPAMTANYSPQLGAHRVSDQMDQLVKYLDDETRFYAPIRVRLIKLSEDRPEVMEVLVRKHINLQSIPRIALDVGCSERSVQYLLAVGNGSLFSAYCHAIKMDGRIKKMGKQTDTFLLALGELVGQLSTEEHPSQEELALAGF